MAQQIVDCLIHWKKKLERGVEDEKALDIIRKLYKVPITVELLQDTGIGKTVKQLGKQGGPIGEKATLVLKKWREVVSATQQMPSHASKPSSKSVHAKSTSEHRGDSDHQSLHSKQKSHVNGHASRTSSLERPSKKMKYDDGCNSSSSTNSNKKHHSNLANGSSSVSDKHSSKYEKFENSLCASDTAEPYNPEHPEMFVSHPIEYKPTPISAINGIKEEGRSKSSNKKILSSKYEARPGEVVSSHKKSEKHIKSECNNHVSKMKYHDSLKAELMKQNGEQKLKRTADSMLKSSKSSSGPSEHTDHLQSSSIQQKTNTREKTHKSKSVKKMKMSNAEEFTASAGSFEACLGFNDIVTSKKKKTSSSKSLKTKSPAANIPSLNEKSKTVKTEKGHSSKSKPHSSQESTSFHPSHSKDHKLLLEVAEPSKPIDLKPVDILSTLPEIQPNYKPLPQIDCDRQVKKKSLSNEEAIMFTSSKRDRTAVYSGRRNYFLTEVPSLFELCTRLLMDNIDSIESLGGVPCSLIKPVLERCTPQQLYRLEDFNPCFLEDTNELWERHCQRDFRTQKPGEGETWRELYLRVFDEKEKKLKALTANISASMSKSNPVRQVKLAYVDSFVKPPRDVARKQAKHGTSQPVSHTVKADHPTKPTPQRPVTPAANPVTKPIVISSSSKKPKMAPLMAKTLKTLKHVYRR